MKYAAFLAALAALAACGADGPPIRPGAVVVVSNTGTAAAVSVGIGP